MKHIYYIIAVIFLIQSFSFAQPKKVFTKSEDILKSIVQSHNKSTDDSERIIITKKILENGYVLESRLGQFWNGADWDNSSLTLYTYTPEGLKTEEIDQFWIEGQWVNTYRYTTTYFVNDIVAVYLEQSWSGTDWTNSYEYASLYNDDLQLTEYDVQQWNGTVWDSLYKTTYTYDNSGNLETITDQVWNVTSWDNAYKYSYQYNTNNNVSEKLTEQWIDGSWQNSINDVYTYNPQNQLELVASFWWPDSVWKESVEIYYAYDSYGNIIDMLTKFWESEELGLQNKYHVIYEYLPGTSLQTKVENQEWNLQMEEWINQWREIKSYDGENVIQNYMTEVWDGSTWQPAFQDNYSYDENGNLDVQLSQNWDGTGWINSFRATHVWTLITSVETEGTSSIPLTYSLEQNYPNPFNPETKIRYTIEKNGPVELIITDILGREIQALVNGYKSSGKYEISWNANNLSSGVYFCQLRAGNFVSTRKMMLVK